jgi:glycosyltransferase involved in cell wall biosynthesis
MTTSTSNEIVIIPAYNEEASIGMVLDELKAQLPDIDVLVISDGSIDRTAEAAREKGATVLDLPHNLGVGGAVQAGFLYAFENGYSYCVRIDGDGQHPVSSIPDLLAEARKEEADLIIASRFIGDSVYKSTRFRFLGIRCLSKFLSMICRKQVTDPTSGFQVLNRKLLYYFSKRYPTDYPEPEALALLRRQGYDFCEVPASFRARVAGTSTIYGWGTFYYMIKVGLALFVDRARPVDVRFAKQNLPVNL